MRVRSRKHYRTNTVNMNELMHIILSLQLMFGSRRALGALLVILALGGIAFGVWYYWSDPGRTLKQADRDLAAADTLWDRDEHVDAVREYKRLLRKSDPVDPRYTYLPRDVRPRLYRRIISHEATFAERAEARDWITAAYHEGINFERPDFEREETWQLWEQVVGSLRSGADRDRNLLDEVKGKSP